MDPQDDTEDPGKILRTPVLTLYKEYIKRWRPVILRSAGDQAVHDRTFSEADGPGCSAMFTLFPGFFADGRHGAFLRQTFKRVLGVGEREVRKCWSKAIGYWQKSRVQNAQG